MSRRMTLTYRDVNDAPDAALPVPLEDGADFFGVREVDLVLVDLSRILVLLSRICWQCIASHLVQTIVDGWGRFRYIVD